MAGDQRATESVPVLRSDEIDTTVAHPARLYDYLLGGKDNYQADRDAAERAYANYPDGIEGVRLHALTQRSFLARTVHHLAGDVGIRQFLDIGTGIPTENNTHEVAQHVAPESRIVYADNDPIVLVHARALLTSTPEGATAYIDGDLRDPDSILAEAENTLDLAQPITIVLLGILHFLDDDTAHRTLNRLREAVPAGSHLVLAHLASDIRPEMIEAAASMSRNMTTPVVLRSRTEVTELFDGWDLLEPGVVQAHRWRPGPDDLDVAVDVPVHAAVARKP